MSETEGQKSLFDKLYWPVIIILVILTIWVFLPGDTQPDNVGTFASSPSEFGGTDVTEACVNHNTISMHYHFDLIIIINSSEVNIPANVGIPMSDCMRSVHTHDDSGHVHVELEDNYDGNTPTLYDFFDIWGYEFNSTVLLNNTGIVSLTINDDLIDLSDKIPEGYRMADGDNIRIELS